MTLRRLNNAGISIFTEYLDKLEFDSNTTFPVSLQNPAYYEIVSDNIKLQEEPFSTRFEAARYIYNLLERVEIKDVERDIGLWAWLTSNYFDILCPLNKNGERRLRERTAYIPEISNYKRYYRHLLLGPYLIYKTHSDNPSRAMALLCKPVNIISDIEAQIAAYQELITNKAVVQLVTNLYYDKKSKTAKRGAGGKGPGSPRRLVTVLSQFELTYDLYAMDVVELGNLLPKEFDRFR